MRYEQIRACLLQFTIDQINKGVKNDHLDDVVYQQVVADIEEIPGPDICMSEGDRKTMVKRVADEMIAAIKALQKKSEPRTDLMRGHYGYLSGSEVVCGFCGHRTKSRREELGPFSIMCGGCRSWVRVQAKGVSHAGQR